MTAKKTTTKKTDPTLTGCWAEVQDVLNTGIDRLLLFGPPGTGKTFAAMHYGLTDGQSAHRLQCTEDMTQGEIVGHPMPIGDEWTFILGPMIEAWEGDGTTGGRVNVDEIDRICGDAESMMLGMTDSPESAYWKHPITKQVHRPRPGFSVVATTNVENMRDLPAALKDRFPVAIRIDRPHPAALERLPYDLRRAAETSADAAGDRRFSIRTFLAFDHLRKSLPMEQAARLCFGKQTQYIIDTLKVEAL